MRLDEEMTAATDHAMAAWTRGLASMAVFHRFGAAGDLEKAETARTCAIAEFEASLDHMSLAYSKLARAVG